ncbi:MAG TPA: hypothetical protein VHC40_14305 [Rhizomicrobium sp.]|nr:hypothetical protein [Rhizomicrobium sp.]
MRARIFSAVFLAFLALLAVTSTGPAAAQPRGRDDVQPLDRLLPGIRRDHPGNFYDAEGPTYGPSGDPHYHLKWMTPDGRVIWFDADARSGRVLRSSPGRDRFDGPDVPPRPGFARPYGPGGYGPPGYGRGFNRGPQYDRPFGGWRGGGRWRR